MYTKNALGNLKNRYLAVLKKCNLLNTFGSLAIVALCLSALSPLAYALENPSGTTLTNSFVGNPGDTDLINRGIISYTGLDTSPMDFGAGNSNILNYGTIKVSGRAVYGMANFSSSATTNTTLANYGNIILTSTTAGPIRGMSLVHANNTLESSILNAENAHITINSLEHAWGISISSEGTFNINNSGVIDVNAAGSATGIDVRSTGTYNITSAGTMKITSNTGDALGIYVQDSVANINHTGFMNISANAGKAAEVSVSSLGTANIQAYALDFKENHVPFVVESNNATLHFANTAMQARSGEALGEGKTYEMADFIDNTAGGTVSGEIASLSTVETLNASLGTISSSGSGVLNQTITLTPNTQNIERIGSEQQIQFIENQLETEQRRDDNLVYNQMFGFLAPKTMQVKTGEEIGEATTVNEVLQKLKNNKSLSENEKKLLTGADLSGRDLSGIDFSGVDLTGTKLWKANLTGANFEGAYVVVHGVKCTYSHFETFYVAGADDYGGMLVFEGASEIGYNLINTDPLSGDEFYGTTGSVPGISGNTGAVAAPLTPQVQESVEGFTEDSFPTILAPLPSDGIELKPITIIQTPVQDTSGYFNSNETDAPTILLKPTQDTSGYFNSNETDPPAILLNPTKGESIILKPVKEETAEPFTEDSFPTTLAPLPSDGIELKPITIQALEGDPNYGKIVISGSNSGSPFEDMPRTEALKWSVYLSPYGSHSSRHDSSGHSTNFGIAGGISKQMTASLSLGAHFDIGYTDSYSDNLGTDSNTLSASFGVNGSYNITPEWYVNASLTGTINQIDSDYSSSIYKASENNSGSAFSASLSTGYMWKINDNNVIAPQIGLNYVYTHTGDNDIEWNNGGSFYNIYNSASNYNALYGTVGLRWLGIYQISEVSTLSPFVSVGISQNLTGNPIESTTTTFGTRYSAETSPNYTSVNANVGVTWNYKDFAVKLDYNANFGEEENKHGGALTFSYNF